MEQLSGKFMNMKYMFGDMSNDRYGFCANFSIVIRIDN